MSSPEHNLINCFQKNQDLIISCFRNSVLQHKHPSLYTVQGRIKMCRGVTTPSPQTLSTNEGGRKGAEKEGKKGRKEEKEKKKERE